MRKFLLPKESQGWLEKKAAGCQDLVQAIFSTCIFFYFPYIFLDLWAIFNFKAEPSSISGRDTQAQVTITF